MIWVLVQCSGPFLCVGVIFEMCDSSIPEQNMILPHTCATMLKFHL